MTLSLTFSQSFFELNVSVYLKLSRISSIFVVSKSSQKCGMFSQKCGNAGKKPKCGISRTIAGGLTPMLCHSDGDAKMDFLSGFTVALRSCHLTEGLENISG